jgi:hypothetical protein
MQQWVSPLAAARSAGLALDVLYIADPSNSYYMRSPSGVYDGPTYFAELLSAHTLHYSAVLFVGSSMGASACLMHAGLATRVLAFGPRIDLDLTHGSFLPPAVRKACKETVFNALNPLTGVARAGHVSIHVGEGNLEDVQQAAVVSGLTDVTIIYHDTFHHNVPMHLEREGLLIPLIKRELVKLTIPSALAAAAPPAEL